MLVNIFCALFISYFIFHNNAVEKNDRAVESKFDIGYMGKFMNPLGNLLIYLESYCNLNKTKHNPEPHAP